MQAQLRSMGTNDSSNPLRRSVRQDAAARDAAGAREGMQLESVARRTLQAHAARDSVEGRAEPAPIRIKPVFMLKGAPKGVADLLEVQQPTVTRAHACLPHFACASNCAQHAATCLSRAHWCQPVCACRSAYITVCCHLWPT